MNINILSISSATFLNSPLYVVEASSIDIDNSTFHKHDGVSHHGIIIKSIATLTITISNSLLQGETISIQTLDLSKCITASVVVKNVTM